MNMSLKDLLHEEYESDGRLVLFKCTECGHTSMSLGSLHAHVEGHWSTLGWFKWHFYGCFSPSTPNKWWEHTEILRVDETTEIEPGEIEQ